MPTKYRPSLRCLSCAANFCILVTFLFCCIWENHEKQGTGFIGIFHTHNEQYTSKLEEVNVCIILRNRLFFFKDVRCISTPDYKLNQNPLINQSIDLLEARRHSCLHGKIDCQFLFKELQRRRRVHGRTDTFATLFTLGWHSFYFVARLRGLNPRPAPPFIYQKQKAL